MFPKKYSQMKLQMKREALVELNRQANEQNLNQDLSYDTAKLNCWGFGTVLTQFAPEKKQSETFRSGERFCKSSELI